MASRLDILARSLHRENEVLETLEKINDSGIDFCLLGGYAVSARGRHRYSVDCDIIIKDLGEIEDLLKENGYTLKKQSDIHRDVYGGKSCKFVKGKRANQVSVDLLVKSLCIRQTGSSWSFAYLRKHSSPHNVTGIRKVVPNVPVLEKEMLLATKIHPARPQDIGDILILSDRADWKIVTKHTIRPPLQKVREQVTRILSRLKDRGIHNRVRSDFALKQSLDIQAEKATKGLTIVLNSFPFRPTSRRNP